MRPLLRRTAGDARHGAPTSGSAPAREAAVIALYALATVVMTWPLSLHLGSHLPAYLPPDQFSAYWQGWSLIQTVTEGLPVHHTPYLFHPHGLDTTVQPRRWIGLITHWPFVVLAGPVAAFNLEGMLGLVISGYAGYRLLRLRIAEPAAAFLGGAFIAFYPQHLVRGIARPNTGRIEWMVVFAALLVWTLDRRREPARRLWPAVALTALAAALNAYVNLKIFILAGLMAIVYVLTRAAVTQQGERRRLLTVAAASGAAAMLLAAPIYLPMAGLEWIGHAVEQFPLGPGVDLASYMVDTPEQPPLLGSRVAMLFGSSPGDDWFWGRFYLGVVSLALVAYGLWRSRAQWRLWLPWAVVALVFFALSLGTEILLMNRRTGIPGPYAALEPIEFFRALRHPHRMPLVFLIGWGVLLGHGCAALLQRLPKNWRPRLWLPPLLAVAMLLELSVVPFELIEAKFSPFNRVLAKQQGCAVIDLPLGRQASKEWMFQQTQHGRPIVEGMSARMPPGAYDYIRENAVLRWFAGRRPFSCALDLQPAMRQLQADGFCHILVHDRHRQDDVPHIRRMGPLFRNARPVYEDEDLKAYRIEDLIESPACTQWKR
jgi:hypothetical protein